MSRNPKDNKHRFNSDNYYDVLNVARNATAAEIRKAFLNMARQHHPDHHQANEAMRMAAEARMKKLNEAYGELADDYKKQAYDTLLGQQEKLRKTPATQRPADPNMLRLAPATPSISHSYRQLRAQLVQQYQQAAKWMASQGYAHLYLKPFGTSQLDKVTNLDKKSRAPGDEKQLTRLRGNHRDAKNIYGIHSNLYDYIASQSQHTHDTTARRRRPASQPSIAEAIDILRWFIRGDCVGKHRESFCRDYSRVLTRVKRRSVMFHTDPAVLDVCEAVRDLVALKWGELGDQLLRLIQRITDYPRFHPSAENVALFTPLFQDRYFRHLVSQALHLYWHEPHSVEQPSQLRAFDEHRLMDGLRQHLVDQVEQQHVGINAANVLFAQLEAFDTFEKRAQQGDLTHPRDLRERGFALLDLIPFFHEPLTVIINILLQVGLSFQHASIRHRSSEQGPHSADEVADEFMALNLYQEAVCLAQTTAPTQELQVLTQVIKFAGAFIWQDATFESTIRRWQFRTLLIADVYPFTQLPVGNLSISPFLGRVFPAKQRLPYVVMARAFLQELQRLSQAGKSDHAEITVLYQVYAAYLTRWLANDAIKCQDARGALSAALLREKKWTVADVERHMMGVHLDQWRDAKGWIQPAEARRLPKDVASVSFRAIDGFTVNFSTGGLDFGVQSAYKQTDYHVTLDELRELIQRDIKYAYFSLDAVDPTMRYHPFQQMRFQPANLWGTALMTNMLFTDYLLKLLTGCQEVAGIAPFAARSLDTLLAPLPHNLRKIVRDYQTAKARHIGHQLHRFWIEATEATPVIEESLPDGHSQRITIGVPTLVIKKHRMGLNERGEMVDIKEADEGWDLYVVGGLTARNMQAGRHPLPPKRAIIFSETYGVLFVENGQLLRAITVETERRLLVDMVRAQKTQLTTLFQQARSATGLVEKNETNKDLCYQLTRVFCEMGKQPHHFTPEYVFAHEMTCHYDEFAKYFPALHRLKEQYRLLTLVGLLRGLRANVRKNCQRFNPDTEEQAADREREWELRKAKLIEQIMLEQPIQVWIDRDKLRDHIEEQLSEYYDYDQYAYQLDELVDQQERELQYELENQRAVESQRRRAQLETQLQQERERQQEEHERRACWLDDTLDKLGVGLKKQDQDQDQKGTLPDAKECFWVPSSSSTTVSQIRTGGIVLFPNTRSVDGGSGEGGNIIRSRGNHTVSSHKVTAAKTVNNSRQAAARREATQRAAARRAANQQASAQKATAARMAQQRHAPPAAANPQRGFTSATPPPAPPPAAAAPPPPPPPTGGGGDDGKGGNRSRFFTKASALNQTGAGKSTFSADAAYNQIRANKNDIYIISKNTGIKSKNIQKVKEHLFFNKHLLDRYVNLGIPGVVKRFDSDLAIANAWKRLELGGFTKQDIQLLKHEVAEAWYMRKHGPSYSKAHGAAHKRYPAPDLEQMMNDLDHINNFKSGK